MRIQSNSFSNGMAIPSEFAFAVIDSKSHVAPSRNRNPHLSWDEVPEGTASFVLFCHDPDVPSRADDVNREDLEVPASLPRMRFYHWVLLDVPPTTRQIEAGRHSDGIVRGGKPGPDAPCGSRHGINSYTAWFANDTDMHGNYYGYDGPAPPWNDPIMHHYLFTLLALDVPHLEVHGALTGENVRAALADHVLAEASITGIYSLNPRLQTSR
jgi:Raf kinase inhibitor-like YbhB/YbcL family protein